VIEMKLTFCCCFWILPLITENDRFKRSDISEGAHTKTLNLRKHTVNPVLMLLPRKIHILSKKEEYGTDRRNTCPHIQIQRFKPEGIL